MQYRRSGGSVDITPRYATKKTLAKKASHFAIVAYGGALRESENELPEVATDMIQKTSQFFFS